MDNRQRLVLLALAVAVAIAAVIVVGSGGDDDDGVIDTRTQVATTTTPQATTDTTQTQTTPPKPPKPEIPVVEIRDGDVAGEVERLRYRKGGDIVFRVRSDDTAGHVHLHGYDVLEDLVPNGTVTFRVEATIEGRFEVELEDTATQIAEIEVVP